MQKEDLAWLIIRATGLFMVLRVLLYIPDLIILAGWLLERVGMVGSESGIVQGSYGLMRIQIFTHSAAAFLSAILGIYLLRRGKAVFRLLTLSGPKF